MEDFVRLVLLVIAVIVLPVCYVRLCRVMRERGVSRPPRVPFFFLFGTVGGWVLAFMLSPSGLTAMCVVLMLSAAPLALLGSSIYLAARPEHTKFHRVAMWGGFGYSAIPAAGLLASILSR